MLEEVFVAAGPAVGVVEAASPAVVAAAAAAAAGTVDFEGGVFCWRKLYTVGSPRFMARAFNSTVGVTTAEMLFS